MQKNDPLNQELLTISVVLPSPYRAVWLLPTHLTKAKTRGSILVEAQQVAYSYHLCNFALTLFFHPIDYKFVLILR